MSIISRAANWLVSKASVAAPYSASTIPYFLFANGQQDIKPAEAWLLYKRVDTLAKVVDLIADTVANLKPVVKIGGEIYDQHPLEELLNRPGFNRNRRLLIKEIAVQRLVTGTAYIHLLGNVRRAPAGLDLFQPWHATHVEGDDGWADRILINEGRRSFVFERKPFGTDSRWVENEVSEIMPVYDMAGDRKGVGLSRVQAIKADVDLKLKGLQHNGTLMDKGARLSGVLSFKNPLGRDQQRQVDTDMRSQLTGATNAGGVIVTQGGDMDFKPFSMTPRDMDWEKLAKIVDEAIVARYNVPVTLFSTDAQTHNNYDTAWGVLYDLAVLPEFKIIYDALGRMISDRIGEDVEIVHDELTSSVLAKKASARAVELFNAQMITINEARDIVGMEPLAGGDEIQAPLGLTTQFEDLFDSDGNALNGPTPSRQIEDQTGKTLN